MKKMFILSVGIVVMVVPFVFNYFTTTYLSVKKDLIWEGGDDQLSLAIVSERSNTNPLEVGYQELVHIYINKPEIVTKNGYALVSHYVTPNQLNPFPPFRDSISSKWEYKLIDLFELNDHKLYSWNIELFQDDDLKEKDFKKIASILEKEKDSINKALVSYKQKRSSLYFTLGERQSSAFLPESIGSLYWLKDPLAGEGESASSRTMFSCSSATEEGGGDFDKIGITINGKGNHGISSVIFKKVNITEMKLSEDISVWRQLIVDGVDNKKNITDLRYTDQIFSQCSNAFGETLKEYIELFDRR